MRTTHILVALYLLAAPTTAQCANLLLPTGPVSGVDGTVHAATAWDPDGPGPLSERLVVGGDFTFAGGVAASRIAVWEPTTATWSPLGSGCNDSVRSLAALPNGRLVAGGLFTTAGGVAANRIAQWDGSTWSPLGSGASPSPVPALTVSANGDLIAGGEFITMGGLTVNGVARWNGSAWSALGAGLPGHGIYALTTLQNGDVVAGGFGPGTGSPNLARWNGTSWSTFGTTSGGGAVVTALASAPNGDLLVGGSFTTIDGVAADAIARWNGAAWSPLGSSGAGLASLSIVRALRVLANGQVVAGGWIGPAGYAPTPWVARWNGSTWAPLASPMRSPTHLWPSPLAGTTPEVYALATFVNGTIVAGGRFTVAGAAAAHHVARWDGAAWNALSTGPGVDGIEDLLVLPGGDIVAVGNFLAAGTVLTNGVARWNGSAWSSLGGSGMSAAGTGEAVVRMPNGDLVVGGSFTSMGGVAANNVARWNGTQWSSVGTLQPGGVVRALAVAPDGTLYAGGDQLMTAAGMTGLAAWNGTAWNLVGGPLNGLVFALTFLPDGRLAAGGWFATTNTMVWNGLAWSPLGPPTNPQNFGLAFATRPDGGLVAASYDSQTTGGRVQRWNGSTWSSLGAFDRPVVALHALPDGDVLAAGWFGTAAGAPAAGLARWNGTTWSAVAAGLGGSDRRANGLAVAASGEVWVGGAFAAAGGQTAGGLARLSTTCPAQSTSLGAGCAGASVASTPPWTGSTWRATANGLPSAALVAVVHGFAVTSLPLATVFGTALPGCTLHVQPDVVDFTPAAGGTATAQFALPNSPALAGTVFHHQMVALALDATLAITATNSLRLTVGSL